MKVTFIQTGGTIDKDYPKSEKGFAFEITDPAFNRILEKINPEFEIEKLSLLRKDSMELDDWDRNTIKETCIDIDCDKIVITHGSDTMIETGLFLEEIKGKTIVITGAMRPERFSNSDAPINLGMALAAVQTCSQGVYIAMSGHIIPVKQTTRDEKTKKFKFK